MSATKLPQRELLTPYEVSDFLRVSLKSIYKWIKMGEFPGARQVGTVWRIPRATVMNMFNNLTDASLK